MTRATFHVFALCAAVTACAGRAAPSRAPVPEVVWPRTGPPRARLAGIIAPSSLPARPGFWRRALDLIVGAEGGARNDRDPFRPFGVAVASGRDAIYVADPDGAALLRFDLAGGEPRKVTCAALAWSAPIAVALTPAGAVLVADAAAAAVVLISPAGSCTPLGAGQLTRPTGIAFAGGRVFVTDPPRHEIVVLSTDGTLVARYGEGGTGSERFHFPSAIEVAADGTVLAVDVLNFRVARLSPEGASKGAIGGPATLRRPKGVATGADGRIYVSDAELDAVLVFGPDGAFEYAIGEPGSGPGQLAAPAGLAISGRHLFVADSLNGRIVVFEILGGST